MSKLCTAANLAWRLVNQPGYVSFKRDLHDSRTAQERILKQYIRRNASTEFGKEHNFDAIDSVEAFRKRVPMRNYDELTGWIDRIAAGEQNILTSDRVIRLATSSGSTRARKLIPYTRQLQGEFNKAIGPWIVDLYRSNPSLARGCAYWSISPVAMETESEAGAVPIGFEEDSAYLGGASRRLVDAVMAVAGEVRHIEDITAFRYVTMLLLLRRADLRLISVWHPSFLELLLDAGLSEWDTLVRDIDYGTLTPPAPIDADLADRLRRRLHPDRRRAEFLRRTGPNRWNEIWPNLGLISCWADAHAADPAAHLSRRLVGIPIQSKGLLATEAFITIPFAGARPLVIASHFFEFVAPDGTIFLPDEVQRGETYSVVVTTAGGLWRYRLGDQVEVEGFIGRTPSLRFIGRDDHVVDRFGEKLSESFVGKAIRDTLGQFHIHATFSMLAPDPGSEGFRYTLFIQAADAIPPELAHQLEVALRASTHYDYCRRLDQLLPLAVFAIESDAFARYCRMLERSGLRLGDIKPTALSDKTTWRSAFDGTYIREPLAIF